MSPCPRVQGPALCPSASKWEHLNRADGSTGVQNQGLTLRDQAPSHSQSPGTLQGHGDSHWLCVPPGPVSLTETNESYKENIPDILHCFPPVLELQGPSFAWQRVNGNSDAQGRCSGAVKVTGSSGPFLASSQHCPSFSFLHPGSRTVFSSGMIWDT